MTHNICWRSEIIMDITELFQHIQNTLGHLSENWVMKLAGAAFVGAACSMHGQLLLAFVALIIIDLITKWIALNEISEL